MIFAGNRARFATNSVQCRDVGAKRRRLMRPVEIRMRYGSVGALYTPSKKRIGIYFTAKAAKLCEALLRRWREAPFRTKTCSKSGNIRGANIASEGCKMSEKEKVRALAVPRLFARLKLLAYGKQLRAGAIHSPRAFKSAGAPTAQSAVGEPTKKDSQWLSFFVGGPEGDRTLEPHGCEPCALPAELRARILFCGRSPSARGLL